MEHVAATRTALAEAIRTLINLGSAGGKIVARTGAVLGSGTVLATWTFDNDCGAVSGPTLTGANFPKEVNGSASGTIGNVEVRDSDDNVVLRTADVGTGAQQASFSSLTVVSSAPIRINSFTYTVPAGS